MCGIGTFLSGINGRKPRVFDESDDELDEEDDEDDEEEEEEKPLAAPPCGPEDEVYIG